MPIDFPTVRLADPAAVAVTAPAATDTVQGRTTAGGDRNFLLGNLAGIAPLVMAADQSAYYNGTTWATYSLTTAGRALSAVAGTANTFPYFSAANVVTLGAVGATGLSLIASANQAAAQSALGLGTAALASVGNSANGNLPAIDETGGQSRILLAGTSRAVYGGRSTAADADSLIVTELVAYAPNSTAAVSDSRIGYFRFLTQGATANNRGGRFAVQLKADNSATVSERLVAEQNGVVRAGADNTQSLGSSPVRWTAVWAVNATIQTSDARLKTQPRQLRDAEFKAASAIARLPAVWRWLNRVHGDENCEPEGREARKHFGPTVQAAIAVMEAHGLDPFAYSFICYDQWEALPEQWHEWPDELDDDGNVIREAGRELLQPAREAGDRYSFRKEELLCFLVAAMARQHDELELRVAALEAKLTP